MSAASVRTERDEDVPLLRNRECVGMLAVRVAHKYQFLRNIAAFKQHRRRRLSRNACFLVGGEHRADGRLSAEVGENLRYDSHISFCVACAAPPDETVPLLRLKLPVLERRHHVEMGDEYDVMTLSGNGGRIKRRTSGIVRLHRREDAASVQPRLEDAHGAVVLLYAGRYRRNAQQRYEILLEPSPRFFNGRNPRRIGSKKHRRKNRNHL